MVVVVVLVDVKQTLTTITYGSREVGVETKVLGSKMSTS